MAPSENRGVHIAWLFDKLWCVRDIFYEPFESRERYCGCCIEAHESLTFADVELVISHRVVINTSGLVPSNCTNCRKILTYGIAFKNHVCVDCDSALRRLLYAVESREFDFIIADPESTVVFHTVERQACT